MFRKDCRKDVVCRKDVAIQHDSCCIVVGTALAYRMRQNRSV